MPKPLDAGQKNILRLIKKDAGPDGWAKVSPCLFPLLQNTLPEELVILKKKENGGIARLTKKGLAVVDYI